MNLLYADLGTCHVSQDDMKILELQGRYRRMGGGFEVTVFEYEEGAFVPLVNGEEEFRFLHSLRSAGLSQEFVDLCKTLILQGVQMLRLDRDSPRDTNLRIYNW